MEKRLEVMRGLFRFAAYFAGAAFLVWRAETFIDTQVTSPRSDMLARVMCLSLAILLLLTGFVRALDSNRAA